MPTPALLRAVQPAKRARGRSTPTLKGTVLPPFFLLFLSLELSFKHKKTRHRERKHVRKRNQLWGHWLGHLIPPRVLVLVQFWGDGRGPGGVRLPPRLQQLQTEAHPVLCALGTHHGGDTEQVMTRVTEGCHR